MAKRNVELMEPLRPRMRNIILWDYLIEIEGLTSLPGEGLCFERRRPR